jgi:hypothetical protein
MFRTLFGYITSLENIVPFGSKRVAMCLRRKRAEVTNFSTWAGRITIDSVKVGAHAFNHATRIGPIPRPRPETVIAPALVSRIQNDHRWRV